MREFGKTQQRRSLCVIQGKVLSNGKAFQLPHFPHLTKSSLGVATAVAAADAHQAGGRTRSKSIRNERNSHAVSNDPGESVKDQSDGLDSYPF